jgi:hypothetical protein
MASVTAPKSAVETPTRTPLQAIAAACRLCIYDPLESKSWRDQIEGCPSERCPLHEHRPRVTGAGR